MRSASEAFSFVSISARRLLKSVVETQRASMVAFFVELAS